ncbi:hypothetical protein ACHAPT_012317 [Fusarium lateritium]
MDAISTDAPSLSKSYAECIRLFEAFLWALKDENCRVVHLKQVSLIEMSDNYGRARIWGDQMKADFPERARGSLDDTLRNDNDLKALLGAIFMRLGGLLHQATSIANKKYDPAVGSDHDSVSSVSADSDTSSASGSGSDSDSDSDDGSQSQRRMPKICLLAQQIADQIRSLYDLSSLLRRPRIADKYIRSVSSKSHQATPDTLPLIASFSKSDESHVVEKMLQWRGLTKAEQSLVFGDEPPAPMRQELATDQIDDILWYCRRLARANTRRREQLQYWTDHPYDPKQAELNPAQTAPDLVKRLVKGPEPKEESGSQTSTLKPSSFKLPISGPKSIMSKQSFSTAAVSDVHNSKTNVRPQTVYAATNVGQGRCNAVPGPPKAEDGKTTFPCPYCGMTLESLEMQNRQSWKRHVFRDLRPYVCTFQDCQSADKLYVSRCDWRYHELQIHRRKYVCKECPNTYTSKTEMTAHVKGHYGESISPAQLSVILDLCDQQVDGLNGEKEECLVCGTKLSLSALQDHLATHMEDMALFVLPNSDEGQDKGGTNDSIQAENLKSKGKISDLRSQASSLGFSAAGDHGQTPTDFSRLLTSEEAAYASKFEHWKVTDDSEVVSMKVWVQQLGDPDEDIRHAAVGALGKQPALPYEIIEAMGKELEGEGSNGQTALSWAARSGHEVTLARLIEKGAQIDSKDYDGWTPLHWAAENGYEAIANRLIEAGADVESRDDRGQTPLHYAAKEGYEDVVRALLEMNAGDKEKDDQGRTPLSLAVEGGHEAVIQLLQPHVNSPVSFQSSEGDHSTPDDAGGVPVGVALNRLDYDSLPPLYKKDGPGWYAVFNPQLQRDLDLDLVHTFEHSTVVTFVRFSHNGMYLATGCNFTAHIFDVQTGQRVCALDHESDAGEESNKDLYLLSVCFSSDDRCLATGAKDCKIYVWDIESREILTQLEGHTGDVWSIDFSSNNRNIVSGSEDRTVRLWNVDTGTNILTLRGQDVVTSVAISPDMQLIAAGLLDKSITIWETATSTLLTRLEGPGGHQDSVYTIAFSPDGESLVSGGLDRTIKMWHLGVPLQVKGPLQDKCITTMEGHKADVRCVAFTPDGNGLFSGSTDRVAQLWDPKTGMAQFLVKGHKSGVLSVDVGSKGDVFATGSGDGKACVWWYGPYQEGRA